MISVITLVNNELTITAIKVKVWFSQRLLNNTFIKVYMTTFLKMVNFTF